MYKCKKDLYAIMFNRMVSEWLMYVIHIQRIMLPPIDYCTEHYLHQVLEGKKSLIFQYDCLMPPIPNTPEFSVKL